jgi:hypothetical protein
VKAKIDLRSCVLVTLLAGGCCGTALPCNLAPSAQVFAQPSPGLVEVLQEKEAFFAASAASVDAADMADACCNSFKDIMATRHCTPRVDAFCDAKCDTDKERKECLGPQRSLVTEECLSESYPLFIEHVKTCKQMTIGENANQTFWPYTEGVPPATCPRK